MNEQPTARAGRPKSEEKRAAILCAAGDLFLSRGLKGTSMDAVAEHAGVSKQTVYSHFASKEDLFGACILHKVESYGFLDETFSGDGDLESALRTLGQQFLKLIFDEQVLAMYRVVIGESTVYPEIAELFFETGPGRTINAIAGFMEAQMNAGRLKRDDPRYTAVLFLNILRGHYHIQLLMNLQPILEEDEFDRHVEKVVGQFLQLYKSQ